jgi:cobyrinic acid a,c-diamide synthase
MRALVVTGPGTGVGKTLVSALVVAALRARGLRVQPYKVGPDYIDGRLHELLAGRACANLDLWLDGAEGVARTFAATYGDADIAVIEGMMGAFDGDADGATSTVAVAAALGAPLLLVLDGWTASQTLAAVGYGLRERARPVRTLGVALNRVAPGGEHDRAVTAACAACDLPVMARIAHEPAVAIQERRLGLRRAEFAERAEAIRTLATRIAPARDLDALIASATAAEVVAPAVAPIAPAGGRAPRVAVADDEAFWFTYPETRLALLAAGARIVPFSPLHDARLPAADALWIGGGFPEDHAPALAANAAMRADVRAAVARGLPTYAECGGYMYLARTLEDDAGTHAMAGALDAVTSLREPALRIGYREATVACDTPLDPAGTTVRGYEFHYACARAPGAAPAYRFGGGEDGIASGSLCASFLHRRFLPGDAAIARFVRAARRAAGVTEEN